MNLTMQKNLLDCDGHLRFPRNDARHSGSESLDIHLYKTDYRHAEEARRVDAGIYSSTAIYIYMDSAYA